MIDLTHTEIAVWTSALVPRKTKRGTFAAFRRELARRIKALAAYLTT